MAAESPIAPTFAPPAARPGTMVISTYCVGPARCREARLSPWRPPAVLYQRRSGDYLASLGHVAAGCASCVPVTSGPERHRNDKASRNYRAAPRDGPGGRRRDRSGCARDLGGTEAATILEQPRPKCEARQHENHHLLQPLHYPAADRAMVRGGARCPVRRPRPVRPRHPVLGEPGVEHLAGTPGRATVRATDGGPAAPPGCRTPRVRFTHRVRNCCRGATPGSRPGVGTHRFAGSAGRRPPRVLARELRR